MIHRMSVYAWSYKRILAIIIITLLLWGMSARRFGECRWWKFLNATGSCGAVIIILRFTVWGRVPSGMHLVMFAAEYSGEFFREMLMNVFLYFPLGITLSCVVGRYSIPAGFLLSFSIETWQFLAGTGVAQGTDVLCNTFGCVLGVLPGIMARRYKK